MRFTVLSILLRLMLGLGLCLPTAVVRASSFYNYDITDLDISALTAGETCPDTEDPAACPGMCLMVLQLNPNPGFLVSEVRKYPGAKLFKKADHRQLLKISRVVPTDAQGKPTAPTAEAALRVTFTSAGQCTPDIVATDEDARKELQSYLAPIKGGGSLGPLLYTKPAYCCCQPAEDNKTQMTNCSRKVDWNIRYATNFTDGIKDATAFCDEGYQVLALKEGLEDGKKVMGCRFYEGSNAAAERAKEEALAASKGNLLDIQNQAKVLSKIPFFTKISDGNLGASFLGWFVALPFLLFLGSLSLVIYIYAGFTWMTAAGNSEKVSEAQQTIVWTSLGVVAILASYILVKLVFQLLSGMA